MRLVLTLGDAAVEFTGELSGGKMPYLQSLSALRMAARAGYLSGLGVGESPSVTAVLSNAGRRVAGIIGHPIRCIGAAYDAAGNLLLQGPISGATFGKTISITIEA